METYGAACNITCGGACFFLCAGTCVADGPIPIADIIGATGGTAVLTSISYASGQSL